MLYCIVLYCIVLHCILLYCTVSYHITLYCVALVCAVLYCIVSYSIVLRCFVLYCIVLHIVLKCVLLYTGSFYSLSLLCSMFDLSNIELQHLKYHRRHIVELFSVTPIFPQHCHLFPRLFFHILTLF